MDLKTETEQKILEAAKKVFGKHGFEGTRMQEIADEAGINKALLHYYFRSKDKLFESVFMDLFNMFFPKINEVFDSDINFREKIGIFIDTYLDLLIANPYLPHFILHEIYREPELIIRFMKTTGLKPQKIMTSILQEIEEGNIRRTDPRHLLVNILGMCLLPFIGKPLLSNIFFEDDPAGYEEFLLERKNEVKEFVIHSIFIK